MVKVYMKFSLMLRNRANLEKVLNLFKVSEIFA
jgi:hypothetical protein